MSVLMYQTIKFFRICLVGSSDIAEWDAITEFRAWFRFINYYDAFAGTLSEKSNLFDGAPLRPLML